MTVDILLLQLAVLLFPGIIWARIDTTYGMKSKPSDTEFFLRAFLFGLATYCVTFIIFGLFGKQFILVDIADAGTKSVLNAAVIREIVIATIVGFVLSILWLYATTYKTITWVLQKIRATKRYGDEDVWDYTFNSSSAAVEYINLRDFEKKLVYSGWVTTFSETDKLRELVLRNVQVFDFDSQLLFEVPLMYLARAPENIHIEFPFGSKLAPTPQAPSPQPATAEVTK